MAKNARVKVTLDTRQAKADLRDLGKEGQRTAGRVNDSVSGGLGRSFGLGAVAGAGFGLAQRAAGRVSGMVPDVLGEPLVGIGATVSEFLGGPEAKAARYAREQTKQAYAEIIGRQAEPQITPEIRNYYNSVKSLREITERGNTAIDKTFGMESFDSAIESISSSITAGFQMIIDGLGGQSAK